MTLPLLLSVPHAGLTVPPEAASYCCLSPLEIAADGDEGAAEVYDLRKEVAEFVTTDVARAIVDLNRAEDDRRADGVVKTHTCWDVPVYEELPPPDVIEQLLGLYYRPYHAKLRRVSRGGLLLAADCHTMAAVGPPIGPDPGETRPAVCLSDGNGATLPAGWMEMLADCFRQAFAGQQVTANAPFQGGYITRTHGQHMPWVQIELSRAPFLSDSEKQARVLQALDGFCKQTSTD